MRVHLQLDTGMARDGAAPDTWLALMSAARRAELAGRIEVVGVMGHLPMADEPGNNASGRRALLRGVEMARQAGLRPRVRHLAATSAALTDPSTHLDMVRIGAGLVGIDPSGHHAAALRVAVERAGRAGAARGGGSRGRVTGTRTSPAARPRWRCCRSGTRTACRVPPPARPRCCWPVDGVRSSGRISMDQVVVDVGDEPIVPGVEAVVFGPGDRGEPTVAEWARWAGTIPHEIVTGIGARVRRSVR